MPPALGVRSRDLVTFEDYRPVFCRIPLNLSSSGVSPGLDSGSAFLAGTPQKGCCCAFAVSCRVEHDDDFSRYWCSL